MYIGTNSKNFSLFLEIFTNLYISLANALFIGFSETSIQEYISLALLSFVTIIIYVEIGKFLYTLYICKTNISRIKKVKSKKP